MMRVEYEWNVYCNNEWESGGFCPELDDAIDECGHYRMQYAPDEGVTFEILKVVKEVVGGDHTRNAEQE